MKVLLLAGGLGTRLGEETGIRPKPMVEIGDKPILYHIMKIYSSYGFNDFVVLTGYKHEVIKDYFLNYYYRKNNITINLKNNSIDILPNKHEVIEDWKITILFTGYDSLTGSRIKQAEDIVNGERFMLTYGDGVADIDINKLVESHNKSGKLCTMTAIQPSERFGVLQIGENNIVTSFKEKPKSTDENSPWINGGFFVCEPRVFDFLSEDKSCIWEQEPLRNIAHAGELSAYKHYGFWRAMDMLKDKEDLNKMWQQGNAPWAKNWK